MQLLRIFSILLFVLSPIATAFVLSGFGFGFEFLILAIVTLVIFILGIVMFVFILKNKSSLSTILSAAFVSVFSIIMFRLSIPFLSDGDPFNWLYVFFKTEGVSKMDFPYLLFFLVTSIYFVSSYAYIFRNMVKLSSITRKSPMILFLFALILVLGYFSVFFVLKSTTTKVVIEDNLNNIFDKSFENRERTVFYHNGDNVNNEGCAHVSTILNFINKVDLEKYFYKTECLNKIHDFNLGYKALPYEVDQNSYLGFPIKTIYQENLVFLSGNETIESVDFEKGDILAVTVNIPNGGTFAIDAPGNPNSLDGSSGAFYVDEEYMRRADDGIIYFQRSEQAVSSYGKTQTVTLFYPINTDLDLKFKIVSYVSEESKGKLKVLEAAVLKTKFSNPDWLQNGKAEKTQRLFMDKSIDLRIGNSREASPVKYGSSIKVSWSSSPDIQICNLKVSFHSDYRGFVLVEDFFDLPSVGEKSIILKPEDFDANEIELDLSCGVDKNDYFTHDRIYVPVI